MEERREEKNLTSKSQFQIEIAWEGMKSPCPEDEPKQRACEKPTQQQVVVYMQMAVRCCHGALDFTVEMLLE